MSVFHFQYPPPPGQVMVGGQGHGVVSPPPDQRSVVSSEGGELGETGAADTVSGI